MTGKDNAPFEAQGEEAQRSRSYAESGKELKGEEILEELLAGLGQDGFGVELHAF